MLLKRIQKIIKPLASLKLAVFIIVALGVLSGWGTIVESQTNARTAQKLVYHSFYMYGVVILLCATLIAVMIDRLPWKKHHAGFILAHVGIIIIIIGSYMTYKFGIDGSMTLDIGKSSNVVDLQDRQFSVYTYFGETNPELVLEKEVDFLSHPVSFSRPKRFTWGESFLEVVDFYNFAVQEEKIEKTEKLNDGPAIRFQLFNDNVSFSKWLRVVSFQKQALLDLGPAEVVLNKGKESFKYKKGNVISLTPDKDSRFIKYTIYTESKGGFTRKGRARLGDIVTTGWMGLQFRVLNYFRHSSKKVSFTQVDSPTKRTTSAVQIKFNNKKIWLGFNSLYRFFEEKQAHIMIYGNKRLYLNFDVELKKFNVGRYQGTLRASSYESEVFVKGLGDRLISMNNPLKHKDFTFYQASFSKDKSGEPTASILSVNWDPGRYLKYLGCLMVVLGSILLFYFKKTKWFYKKKPSID